jgi:ketose-bisphosphate aldolase
MPGLTRWNPLDTVVIWIDKMRTNGLPNVEVISQSGRLTSGQILQRAAERNIILPAFNIPYLPMMQPTIAAMRDTDAAGFVMVARLEWTKFAAGSLEAVAEAFAPFAGDSRIRLHLDHIPVVDEDGHRVDFLDDIRRALDCGYESVMIDGSRLSLEENIRCTQAVVDLVSQRGPRVAVEGELGAVMGHESGPLPPYEELYASGRGFTDPDEASRFVNESGVDWLSVAIGNIHGAIAGVAKTQPKVQARINLEHLARIRARVGRPLVLHGGTGIVPELVRASASMGMAKINIGTATRQAYERLADTSVAKAQQAVYDAAVRVIRDDLQAVGTGSLLTPAVKD